ncbi:MAG: ABC transporter ATP-binding protein/permease [Pegethrix bostrychoides GSE-TBD4-15B]|jgi:ATP-binding cassette subfamily B protein|uniref:ABC transporter ATP-binding protein/permease n=1 Tax=Pegethrix bostrychoides GSE-TBD4-15B TaxID=2839662 RepID=A0A951U483_9CYAN|nr:ABC transporter ATP-binding protein/permease [Pegethrix bostrychoides GSE-TBD4-15B]
MESKLPPVQALRRSLWMVVQAAPLELRNLALLNLFTGVGPSISLFLGKVVIDEISKLLNRGVVGELQTRSLQENFQFLAAQPKLIWAIGISVLLGLVVDAVDSIGSSLFAALRDRVQGYVQGKVLDKVGNFDDIALFESPDLLNLLELANKGIQRVQRLSFIVAATFVGIFIFVPSVLVSMSINWWVPPVLMLSSIPSILIEIKYHKKSWRVEETQASLTREMDIYSKMLTGEAYAKEVRLFSLQTVLLNHWQGLFARMFGTMDQVRREGALAVMLWALVSGLGIVLPYIYVIVGVLRGSYTLGDLALYTGIILQVRRSLYILISNTGDIYDVALATAPIFQLLDLEPQMHSGQALVVAAANLLPADRGIQLQDVTFRYPGSDRPILESLNFAIRPGEMVALVGENGAGKTTLAKLLCRLYDPASGSIIWNGQDLRQLDLTALRSRIAVVMQDYTRFPASLRQNVGWGYLPQLQNDSAIQAVLKDAGIERLIGELSQGLETPALLKG